MNNTCLLYAFFIGGAVALSACGSGSGNSSPPALSSSIVDRMGRAGVNTALTDPFDSNLVREDIVKDNYNSASNPAQWASLYQSSIAGNLAIIDGLDQNCGNQLLAAAGPPAQGRYNALAGVLADDQLYVNTASGVCNQYLAVEANAVGIFNGDCGGRTPLYNTIDTTYSVLAIGALSGVTNGITQDGDGVASRNLFPFLDNAL